MYILRFVKTFGQYRIPGYFERIKGKYCMVTLNRDSAMRFDSILDANNYREHRIALQETIIEEYSPTAPE